jgi:hypothetical protein
VSELKEDGPNEETNFHFSKNKNYPYRLQGNTLWGVQITQKSNIKTQ